MVTNVAICVCGAKIYKRKMSRPLPFQLFQKGLACSMVKPKMRPIEWYKWETQHVTQNTISVIGPHSQQQCFCVIFEHA